jgi:hypothetical protein
METTTFWPIPGSGVVGYPFGVQRQVLDQASAFKIPAPVISSFATDSISRLCTMLFAGQSTP